MPASADSDGSVAETVALMATYIREATASPKVQAIAAAILSGLTADRRRRADAVFEWVRRSIQFVPDEIQACQFAGDCNGETELLIKPELLIEHRRGDCDDFTMLACSLLLLAGVPCHITTVAADRGDPARFSHVYATAILEDGTPYPLDASHGPAPGWETPEAFRRQQWPIFLAMRAGLGNLAAIDWGKIIDTGVTATADIFRSRLGQPPPGTYIQTPEGGITYRTSGSLPGFQTLPPIGVTGGSNLLTLGLILGGGLLLVSLLGRR
jgi:hypothetical protein